ncbi:hypothetical protein N7U66_18650 [Lacinutrix neustonica]|uniref:Uncharacterized protein n=1 Tax=Lacinutrix neustonica TaxID=2980107 RepID=A0A9E8MVK7_9FLAO|nr:hypothetical protein [Lacinutrix neustonica]WAC01861.1 hypothetical protein N7U66_18650 [Lacinutrix neustonica]
MVYRNLTIADKPAVLDLEPLATCESFDGEIIYNLVNAIPQAILDSTELLISFYNTLDDANLRENTIVSPTNYNTTSSNETIFIRLDNSNGNCFSVSELELTIIDPPAIDEFEEYFFCNNDATAQITIDVGNLPLPLDDYNFLWLDSNETTPEIQVNQEGTYYVRVIFAASVTPENPKDAILKELSK